MTTVATLDFDGGTPGATVTQAPPITGVTGTRTYTTDARHGPLAMLTGPNIGWVALSVAAVAGHFRLRFYVKATGTISNHHLFVTTQASNNATVGDLQFRNFSGVPRLYNRVNFAAGPAGFRSDAYPLGSWRRIDYEWVSPGNATTYVYDPADDTSVLYTLVTSTAAATGPASRVLLGNSNNISGLSVPIDSVALTDGTDPGPYVVPSSGPAVAGVMLGGVLVPAHIAGVMLGGVLTPASLATVS